MGLEDRTIDSICPPLRRFLQPRSAILDVGCGPGVIALEVASSIEGVQVVGVDRRSERVEGAWERAADRGVANLEFREADACALPFADGAFDLADATHVFEHIEDRVAALREMKRVVKPEGWVVASVLDTSTALFYPPCPAMESIFRSWAQLATVPDFAERTDPGIGRQMFALAMEAGLNEVEVEFFAVPDFTAQANHPESIHRVFVQGRHRARSDHKTVKLLIEAGLLDSCVPERAQAELEVWRNHPGAFHTMGVGVLLIGKS